MKIGLVGLGRMGAGLAERARRGGHTVIGFDTVAALSEAASLQALVTVLEAPRTVWVMVPSGDATEAVIAELATLLDPGDILIDGGNSYYKDTLRRAALLESKGIQMLDCGTSGGIRGLQSGFCIMAGGSRAAYDHVEPLLAALAPPGGYAFLGPSGAGHYAKMVHNGIEYGLLQAYAEGFHLLHAAGFDYDLPGVAKLWSNGSVVRSWLLELAAEALARDPGLEQLRGHVDDSGEGRWTVIEAVERGVPVPAISSALYARFASRDDNSFASRIIAALRNEFGGHATQDA